jgi:hypothetical protein
VNNIEPEPTEEIAHKMPGPHQLRRFLPFGASGTKLRMDMGCCGTRPQLISAELIYESNATKAIMFLLRIVSLMTASVFAQIVLCHQ